MGRLITVAAVHTEGINWESVGAIAACVAVIMSCVLWIFNRRDQRQKQQNDELRADFTEALNHLSDVLSAKMETKDAVSKLAERIARLEAVAAQRPAGIRGIG